jgi:ankyrin repeat protein
MNVLLRLCMYAQCEYGHGTVVQMLLEAKADPEARTHFNDIPLHFCDRNGMHILMMWHGTEQ